MIDLTAAHAGEAVIAPAVELDSVEPFFQQRDERQKAVALQPVFIKPLGQPVRRRDDNRAGLQQGAEQPFQDHRIGDVVDLELVKAQQHRLAREIGCDLRDRLLAVGAALLLDAVVHIEHKGMEMHPPLPLDRHGGKEHVHQHRLAAPDRAPQIDPLWDGPGLGQAEPTEKATPLGRGAVIQQRLMQPLQPRDDALLRRVGVDLARRDPLAIQRGRTSAAGFGGARHGRSGSREVVGHRGIEHSKKSAAPKGRDPGLRQQARQRNGALG